MENAVELTLAQFIRCACAVERHRRRLTVFRCDYRIFVNAEKMEKWRSRCCLFCVHCRWSDVPCTVKRRNMHKNRYLLMENGVEFTLAQYIRCACWVECHGKRLNFFRCDYIIFANAEKMEKWRSRCRWLCVRCRWNDVPCTVKRRNIHKNRYLLM